MQPSLSSHDNLCREGVVFGEVKDGSKSDMNTHRSKGGINLQINGVDNFEDQPGPSCLINTHDSMGRSTGKVNNGDESLSEASEV